MSPTMLQVVKYLNWRWSCTSTANFW
jgi:hypothetical protein